MTKAAAPSPSLVESSLSLKDFAFIVCSRVRLILTVAVVFLAAIAFAVFWLLSPTYESKARVHVDLQSGSLPVLRAQGMYVSDAEKLAFFETVLQELKNPVLVNDVVKELHLGERRVIGNIERLRNLAFDIRRSIGKIIGIRSWQAPRDPVADAAQAVVAGFTVNRLENSTILELVYQAKDPTETQETLEAIIRRFIESRTDFTREKAVGSSQFLSKELDRLRAEMTETEESWVALLRNNVFRMPSMVMGKGVGSAGGENTLTGLAASDTVVEEMKLHVIKMIEELQGLLTQYPETDPRVQRVREGIRSYIRIINEAPQLQTRLNRLKREISSKESVYRELLAAYENTVVMESQRLDQLSTIKVVQKPGLPASSVKPKRTLAMLAGVILGLFLGVTLAFVVQFFDDGIRRPIDVERRLGLRLVSSLPDVF